MKTFLKSIFLMAMALFATAKPVFAQENEQHQSKHYQFTLEDCIRFAFSNSYDRQSMGSSNVQSLKVKDCEYIAKNAKNITMVSPVVNSGGQVVNGSKNWSGTVYGGSTDYLQIRKYDIATGVNFTDDDIKKYAKVDLIMSLPFIVNVLWMAISFVSCAVLGLIAGFFPALKASRTDPINALRYE
jgi:hypothetical protein